MSAPTNVEILEGALALLERDDVVWLREYGDPFGAEIAVCVGTACERAYYDATEIDIDPKWRVVDVGELDLPTLLGLPDVPVWNDAPERTREDVLALLRERIAFWRAAEAS